MFKLLVVMQSGNCSENISQQLIEFPTYDLMRVAMRKIKEDEHVKRAEARFITVSLIELQ